MDSSQTEKSRKFAISGYVKDLVTVSVPSLGGTWTFDNLIHNRINFKYFARPWLTVQIEGRNRLFFGNTIQNTVDFKEQLKTLDFIPLAGSIAEQKPYLLYSNIDRALLRIEREKWSVSFGKQRINWSKTFAWNPNDIFNAYSFYDFDYEERRGCDAALIKYNINPLSTFELASTVDSNIESLKIASNYRFNFHEFDYQLIIGKYSTDIVCGVGWAGQLRDAGFKGEISWFRPYITDSGKSTLIGDVSFDYSLSNNLTFRGEAIINTNPLKKSSIQFLSQPLTAKALVNNYISVFSSIGYDITPLIKTSGTCIWNIDDKSFFINPSLDYSISNNVSFFIAAQVFTGAKRSLYDNLGSYFFTRLKFNF